MNKPAPKPFDGSNYKISEIRNFLYHEGFNWHTVASSDATVLECVHEIHKNITFCLKIQTKPNGTKYVDGAEWKTAWKEVQEALQAAPALTRDSVTLSVTQFVDRVRKRPYSKSVVTKPTEIDLVIDNTLLDRLPHGSLSNQESALGLLKRVARLPNIRVIIPQKVADECLTGTPPVSARKLLENASRMETDEHGVTTETIGKYPHIFIWYSPEGAKLVAKKHKGDNGGEQNIMAYCKSPACTRPVIIASDDNNYFLPALKIGRNTAATDFIHTHSGHSIGYLSTRHFLDAVQKTLLPQLDVNKIIESINKKEKGAPLRLANKLFFHYRGLNQSNTSGPLLVDVLKAGMVMQRAANSEDTPLPKGDMVRSARDGGVGTGR